MEEPKHKTKQEKVGNDHGRVKKHGLLGTIFRYSDPTDIVLMALGSFGCLVDGSTSPLIMLILSKIMNKYGVHSSFNPHDITKDSLALLYLAFAIGLGAFLEGLCWARTAERQTSRLRKKYLRAVLRQDAEFLDKLDSNSTTYQIVSSFSTDTLTIQGVLSEKIPNFLMNMGTFVISEVVAVYLCWKLAVVAIPMLSLLIVPGIIYGRMLVELGKKILSSYGVAGSIAEQAFSSIRTVYSCGGENNMKKSYSAALKQSLDLGIKQGLVKGYALGSIGLAFAVWSFQAWYGSILVTEMGLKGGDVFTSGVCTVVGGLALGSSLANVKFLMEAAASVSLIADMIERVPTIISEEQGTIIETITGELAFKEVYFAYPTRPESMVLQNFSLTVKSGQTVGLVGGSGSGKSTIISLVERFYDPLNGGIFMDGIDLKTLQLKWVRSQIGLVSQEPVLFATSIRENILFGKEDASMDEVIDAAKAANAHNFIRQLPDGYNTEVGQSGMQMSGDQKQRIAITRALLKNPRILLFDEATSALDSQSEKLVQDALDQASMFRTTIIVAHRLTTLVNADFIAVMESGKIVESGSHIDLIQNKNSQYFRMVQLQQTAVKDGEPSVIIDDQDIPTNDQVMAEVLENGRRFPDQEAKANKQQEDDSTNGSLWHLWQLAAPERTNALLGGVAAASFGAVQPIHSICTGGLLSAYFINNHSEIKKQTKIYSLLFLLNAVISVITSIIQHYNIGYMGEHLTKRVREKLVEKIMTFEVEWFEHKDNTSGALCSRLTTEATMVQSLVCDRLSILAQVFSAVILSVLLGLMLAWRLATIIIALQPLIIGSFYVRAVLMKRMSIKILEAQNKSSILASEAVKNHRQIAAFSAEDKIMKLFEATLKDPNRETKRQSWYAGLGLFISQFLTAANTGLIIWYGGKLLYDNKITHKHLFQTFFILVTTGRVIAEAGSMTSDLSKGTNAVKSVFTILKRKNYMEPNDFDGIQPEKIEGNIELNDIVFAYPARPQKIILHGLSLKIEAGITVALVGQSGCGKSTIISIIERFYDPIVGIVKIDGVDIKSYNLRALRSHIALVSQEPTLFEGTIRDNITYGIETATEAEVIQAASLANAHEFISCMKDGYETNCGERGVQVSGGQKQRIAIARAILKNASILLFDEATSALDSVSESLVQEAMEKIMVGRTCIMIAHRLSTIQKADSIVVINEGKVAEEGSHQELLAKGEESIYSSLVRLQQIDRLRGVPSSGSNED